ncbi:hypothetical protein GGTG_03213 [Gaeumannomyces tritici R3-111a-1]|uniref:Methyltransferase domain-containing protein n=1 Tax=Gaeumannomyces tritici (strain R3-111a-1) TaxID=644352 RepID=J3NPK5_GAET3|nr:hypothetical protein GGTG_03213 [Gaeumannomyces tritici R3-111a-1]EJT78110.1 hypothetical protein GGTG_03213 [Gaeumannomyces tritici R3-111a-1]
MPSDFDKQEYWRDRFSSETDFEWLAPSATLMDAMEPLLARLPATARILHLGSGTSDLQNHLRRRGFLDVTNVDYEPLALERGRRIEAAAFAGDVRTRYLAEDVTRPGLAARLLLRGDDKCGQGPSRPFDLVVDKSTADAVSCGGDGALLAMLAGVRECMADSARWVSLSYSATRYRRDGLPFHVEVMDRLPTPKLKEHDPDIFHWVYLLSPRSAGGVSSRLS